MADRHRRELHVHCYRMLGSFEDAEDAAQETLLREDDRCSMRPTPGLHVGRPAVVSDWLEDGFEGLGALGTVARSVSRQPAVAFYLWQKREDAYVPLTIDVLRIADGAIAEIVTSHDDQFPLLGLRERLPAEQATEETTS